MLFDNYDFLMDSPNSTVKMRKLILQLAIQGKLVEQDPTDEPASELLKRIKAEKEKLIAEGKIKKQKPLLPITEDEIPYELPQGWEWVRMKKIAYNMGQKKPDKRFTYIDVTAINKEKGTISNQVKMLEPSEAPSRARKIVQKETVIYSTVRPYLLNVAIVDKEFEPEPIVSTAFAILNPYKDIYNKYLYYFLRSKIMIDYVESKMIGMAYPAINDTQFLKAPFPLPPLAEQKRITAKVEQLMQLCDQLDACQKKASTKYKSLNDATLGKLLSSKTIDEFAGHWQFLCDNFDLIYNDPAHVNKLRQAILQLAVQGKLAPQDPNDQPASELLKRTKAEREKLIAEGKIKKQKPIPPITENEIPYELPLGWEWVYLPDITAFENNAIKRGPFGSAIRKEYFVPDGYKVYEQRNAIYDDFTLGKYFINEKKFQEMKSFQVKPKDIIISCSGTIGKVAIAHENIKQGIINQALLKITLNEEAILNKYFKILFENFVMKSSILQDLKGTAMKNITSVKILKTLPLPIPTKDEQERIVSKVDQLMHLCDELETRLNQSKKDSEILMQAVLHEVFS